MNYLAHLFLSPNDPYVIAGNFIADQVTAPVARSLDPRIQKGIELHRWIDNTTDHHPIFMSHRKSLYPRFSKYAGVVLDVVYDHLLMLNWEVLSEESFEKFEARVENQLVTSSNLLPERQAMMVENLAQKHWLRMYASIHGMNSVFARLNSKLSFPISIENTMTIIADNVPQWQEEHLKFIRPFILERQRWENLSLEV